VRGIIAMSPAGKRTVFLTFVFLYFKCINDVIS